ncbi:MAG: cupin domain-containing protein [Actinomycetota bacterium]|nr:cupin domain-containing protein [Actinomycetota bacterium]
MIEEARLEETAAGLVPATDGWFVVNVRDGRWVTNEALGDAFIVEGDNVAFQVGYTIGVLQPGQAGGRYHHESDQEDFLVLAGECLLLIEEGERPLKAWDFVHCPPGTDHSFVGAGTGPCVIFMTGARSENKEIVYPRSELAIRHGAGVETETSSPAEAYAPFPKWKDERPKSWDGLPWA